MSSLILIINTYVNSDVVNYIDTLISSIYVIEMIFKVIAYGLFFNNGSYLKDDWNKFDFLIGKN